MSTTFLLAMFFSANAAPPCGQQAFSTIVPPEAVTRASFTHPSPGGAYSATSKARESEIDRLVTYMKDEILNFHGPGRGDIPPMELVPAEGVAATYVTRTTGDNGVYTHIRVSGLGPTGKMMGTLLLPVSGHVGQANAIRWSTTDTYTIGRDTSPFAGGESDRSASTTETTIVSTARSLDLVTTQEFEVDLEKGKTVYLFYYRSGSSGPAGYLEGRVIELEWDGN